MTSKRPSAMWRDGGLVKDGIVEEHAFTNRALAELVRRVVQIPGDAKPHSVFMSELAVYVNGTFDSKINEICIYWYSCSELIYMLTGVNYCTRIVLQSGTMDNGGGVMFDTPRIFLVRKNGHRTPLRLNEDIRVCRLKRNIIDDALYIYDDYRQLINVNWRALRTVFYLHDNLVSVVPTLEIPSFVTRVAAVYHRLHVEPSCIVACGPRVEECLMRRKRIPLIADGSIENTYLSYVCLNALGVDATIGTVLGMLYRKRGVMDKHFRKHLDVWNNAHLLAIALNSIYDNRQRLPVISDRLQEDDMVTAVREFYRKRSDVRTSVVFFATRIINDFHATGSVVESYMRLGLPVKLDSKAPMGSVVDILRL